MGARTLTLHELLGSTTPHDALAVTGVSLDSRDVRPGDLYVALDGASTHGIRHAASAVRDGAVAVALDPDDVALFDHASDAALAALRRDGVRMIEVPRLASRIVDIAARLYAEPDRALTLVAVTGTDGKTSVCRFVAAALTALGTPCGYIGTLGWGMGESLAETALTTPDALALRRMLAVLRERGARAVALEASSHALATGRLDGLAIDVAVLTNLGRDHLDYHGDVAAYRAAKARLFDWPSLSGLVLNGEDAFGREIAARASERTRREDVPELTLYHHDERAARESGEATAVGSTSEPIPESTPDARHVHARDVRTTADGLAFTLVEAGAAHRVDSALMGRFNVDNLLACYGVLRALGHVDAEPASVLGALAPVPGRMERFDAAAPGRPTVLVDYAHTPQALSAALAAAREHCVGELWVVFGCGGDRDRGKRAPMGRAAERADRIVVTDDNPRGEASADIIAAILDGLRERERAVVMPDRREAIAHAVCAAAADDVVLVAGKGHEDYQIVGDTRLALSDRACVHALLAEAC